METTKLSSKGQVVLPKSVREAHGWTAGTEFVVESTPDGVQSRTRTPFPPTELRQVLGAVQYSGPAKSLEDMDAGVRREFARRYRRGSKRQAPMLSVDTNVVVRLLVNDEPRQAEQARHWFETDCRRQQLRRPCADALQVLRSPEDAEFATFDRALAKSGRKLRSISLI